MSLNWIVIIDFVKSIMDYVHMDYLISQEMVSLWMQANIVCSNSDPQITNSKDNSIIMGNYFMGNYFMGNYSMGFMGCK